VRGAHAVGYPTSYPGPDAAEQDPAAWLGALGPAIGGALAAAGAAPDDVAAIAFTGQCDGCVAVDAGTVHHPRRRRSQDRAHVRDRGEARRLADHRAGAARVRGTGPDPDRAPARGAPAARRGPLQQGDRRHAVRQRGHDQKPRGHRSCGRSGCAIARGSRSCSRATAPHHERVADRGALLVVATGFARELPSRQSLYYSFAFIGFAAFLVLGPAAASVAVGAAAVGAAARRGRARSVLVTGIALAVEIAAGAAKDIQAGFWRPRTALRWLRWIRRSRACPPPDARCVGEPALDRPRRGPILTDGVGGRARYQASSNQSSAWRRDLRWREGRPGCTAGRAPASTLRARAEFTTTATTRCWPPLRDVPQAVRLTSANFAAEFARSGGRATEAMYNFAGIRRAPRSRANTIGGTN
jgi:hypothetical protein